MSHQQQGLARCFTMNAMHAQRHGSDHRPTSSRGRSDRTCRSLRLPVAAWLASAWLALSASAYQNSFFGAQRPFSGQPAGPVRQVQLTCLNTFAGPPFNFRMRCPDTANITEYLDSHGAYHRVIQHAPLKGVTSEMMRWWFSPYLSTLSPQVVYNGKHVYWYKLWHPLDHELLQPYLGLHPDIPAPALFAAVFEHYRPAQGERAGYNLTVPVFIADSRIGVQLRAPGGAVVASFLNRPWHDSPQGLMFTTELILGPNVAPKAVAQILNKVLVQPVEKTQFPGLTDQVTRHHIEEMGNMEIFLPKLFSDYCGPACRTTLKHPLVQATGTLG